ncbi:hypothetical protein OF83DRAFT_1295639 [Amylostereum chailletii]|nr:hypothetical protein OF83DRAFT_1295639 [Amylostereum chailletii]
MSEAPAQSVLSSSTSLVLSHATAAVNAEQESSDATERISAVDSTATRPAKRTKSSEDHAIKKPRRRQGCLSRLPSMPLDMLFEIFRCLHPSDLLQLARVSKPFRQILMSEKRASLWRDSYVFTDGAPLCPEGMSEPAWAHLLFGGAYCHLCGGRPVRVHFTLLRRVCRSCLAAHLLTRTEIQEKFNGRIDTVLNVMVSTYESKLEGHKRLDEFWWDEDVEKVEACLERLVTEARDDDDITEKATEMLTKWARNTEMRIKFSRTCEEWREGIENERLKVLKEGKKTRREEISRRLLDQGYLKADVDALSNHREVKNEHPLTDRVWKRVQPILAEALVKIKANRLAREKKQRCEDRKRSINAVYDKLLQTIPPSEWHVSISREDVHAFEDFKAFIEEDRQNPTYPEDRFAGVREQFLEYMTRCAQRRHDAVLAIRNSTFVTAPRSNPESGSLAVSERLQSLSCALQSTQFVQCDLVFGAEALLHVHARTAPNYAPLKFDTHAYAAVNLLLDALGLDPSTTTVADLDRLDPALICVNCPILRRRLDPSVRGRLVYSWRSYASRRSGHDDSACSDAKWRVLTDSEKASCGFSTHEPSEQGWMCNRCAYHLGRIGAPAHHHVWYVYDRWEKREAVRKHLREAHGIDEPVDGEDLVQQQRIRHDTSMKGYLNTGRRASIATPGCHRASREPVTDLEAWELEGNLGKGPRRVSRLLLLLASRLELTGSLVVGGAVNTHSGTGPNADAPTKKPTRRVRRRTEPSTGPVRKGRGRLRDLPSMPLDILFEIFGHLEPGDLVQLTRVTKPFRQILLTRRQRLLWKSSFDLVPGTPDCPEDVPEPVWANLLFGGAYCHSCGARPVLKIIFSLMRRACKACMNAHLLNCDDISNCQPDFPEDLLELIPSTDALTRSQPEYLKFWWDEDVDKLWNEFCALDSDDNTVSQTTNEWVMSRLVKTEDRMTNAVVYDEWERCRVASRAADLEEIRAKRCNEIERRAVAAGYHADDVGYINDHREFQVSKPMTERIWKRVFPILHPLLEEARTQRLEREMVERKHGRTLVLETIYVQSYIKDLPSKAILCLPSLSDLIAFGDFDEVIDQDVPISDELVQCLIGIFPTTVPLIEACTKQIKRDIFARIPEDLRHSFFTSHSSLELAACVFKHIKHDEDASEDEDEDEDVEVHCGLDVVSAWCNSDQRRDEHLIFDRDGHGAVQRLLSLLNLPPMTTTAAEMDRLDRRFVCQKCPAEWVEFGSEDANNIQIHLTRNAMTWRGWVEHVRNEHEHAKTPYLNAVWIFDEENSRVMSEAHGEERVASAWGCCHCTWHLDVAGSLTQNWPTMQQVTQHLNTEHNIQTPVVETDIFFNSRIGRPKILETCYNIETYNPS